MPLSVEQYQTQLDHETEKLRKVCLGVAAKKDTTPAEAAILEGLTALHKRLGDQMMLTVRGYR